MRHDGGQYSVKAESMEGTGRPMAWRGMAWRGVAKILLGRQGQSIRVKLTAGTTPKQGPPKQGH